jgi:hypothetical protein
MCARSLLDFNLKVFRGRSKLRQPGAQTSAGFAPSIPSAYHGIVPRHALSTAAMRSSWRRTLIVRPAVCRMEHVKTVRKKLRTVIRQGPLKVMMKLPAKPPPPAIVDRTVKMPRRRPNAELRSREHLTDAEIERLMATAWNNRWGPPRRDHDPRGVPSRAQ